MINIIQAENLKCKRTFSRKLMVLAPLFFAMYAICIMFFIADGSKYYISMVFNWWPLIFMPLGTALLCSLAHMREKKSGNYKSSYLYNISKTAVWFSKISVIASYTFISTIELFTVVILSNILVRDRSISITNIFEAAIVCWIASLVLIPIHLFISSLFGTAISIITSIVGIIAGVIASTESFWILIPWSFGLRLMCPIIGVHPNGTILPEGSPLLSPDPIVKGIVISLVFFAAVSFITSIWFNKREVH
ncbi:lantibiotic immunity ABC transporter MutE/EpiE family permease subunit [Clostridium sp.]|uniref:lantibiotic immunity ABC transporter MutE/EpiE family permease subunit n=1 Tax=Clostridium sp. TaxID=1506 RepID=UPI002612B852|nr:lantibiotic immunity ABC transporter MutE/EpiE family permease subunit [Clostridium sp.]